MNKEPALTVASVTALVSAILALAAAFGFDLSKEQTTAILGFVAVVAPLVTGFVTRQHVSPKA